MQNDQSQPQPSPPTLPEHGPQPSPVQPQPDRTTPRPDKTGEPTPRPHVDPDLPDPPGPPLSDPESPHGSED